MPGDIRSGAMSGINPDRCDQNKEQAMTRSEEEVAFAQEYGYHAEPDEMRGEGWYRFVYGSTHVWFAPNARDRSRVWTSARLELGQYRYHQSYHSLRDALLGFDGLPFGPDEKETQAALDEAKARKGKKQDNGPLRLGLKDDDRMPFGKYQGECLKDVPASYLNWLWNNGGKTQTTRIADYIRRNLESLKKENLDMIW